MDLSFPPGFSVNNDIDSRLMSLHYSSLDNVVAIIQRLRPGTLMAKLDLKSAYCLVPVHPDDGILLGTCWKDSIYQDAALPFGLASAPKIFSAVTDFLLWVMHSKGVHWLLHYLDDFILFGCPSTDKCLRSLQIALSCYTELGWEAHKVDGPASCITFLGIEIDTTNSQLRLPSDKLQALKSEIEAWDSHRSCTEKQLLSLIGQLSHSSKVIKPGRSFLCRLIDLSSSASQLHHHIL